MSVELVRYDAMCRAIDVAYEVDEVKDIRDKAMAIEAYARQAKNTEAERRACEIRLRAERKAGQLLSTMEKRSNSATSNSSVKSLDELGISRDQSSKWQQLAGVPEEQFEAALAAPDKPTTSGLINKTKTFEPMNPKALWLWGRLRDFERDGIIAEDFGDLLSDMTDAMRADVLRLAPLVADFLYGVVNDDAGRKEATGDSVLDLRASQ